MVENEDGVPFAVQEIKYSYADMSFALTLCSGAKVIVAHEYLLPWGDSGHPYALHLMQREPTPEQYVEARKHAEVYVLANWVTLHSEWYREIERYGL